MAIALVVRPSQWIFRLFELMFPAFLVAIRSRTISVIKGFGRPYRRMVFKGACLPKISLNNKLKGVKFGIVEGFQN